MQVIVIESHEKESTEWGISFTDHNPKPEDYFPMDKETAFRLKEYLATLPASDADNQNELWMDALTIIVDKIIDWRNKKQSADYIDILKDLKPQFTITKNKKE